MKLAITGGTGFVGSHLLDVALAAGHEVKALTRREQPPRDGVDWIAGDLASRDALERLVDDADAVIHVAGTINAPNAAGFEKGNVEGTLAMLAAATAGGVRPLRPRLLARRARAQAVALRRLEAARRGAGAQLRASTGRSSVRPRSTVPATRRRSSCSGWPSSA